MEHVVPAQWTGEELTFELTLVICHGEKTCLVADAVDTGFCLLASPPVLFGPQHFGDLLAFPSQSMWFVWGDPKTWLQGGYVTQVWPIRASHASDQ